MDIFIINFRYIKTVPDWLAKNLPNRRHCPYSYTSFIKKVFNSIKKRPVIRYRVEYRTLCFYFCFLPIVTQEGFQYFQFRNGQRLNGFHSIFFLLYIVGFLCSFYPSNFTKYIYTYCAINQYLYVFDVHSVCSCI